MEKKQHNVNFSRPLDKIDISQTNISLPVKITYQDRQYILKGTKNNKLVLHKDENEGEK